MKKSQRPRYRLRLLVPSAGVLLILLGVPLVWDRPVPTVAPMPIAGAVEPHHSPNVPPSTSVRSTAAGPRVRAPTAILVDLKTGRVLFAKQPDQRRPIASLAKIMTAMVVLERSKLSDVVEVSRRAANAPPTRMVGVKTGFTQAAGNCVVGAATRGDQSLVAVVLGDPAATAWRAAYSDVRNLLDFGFGLDLSSVARASIPVPVPSLLPGAEPSFLRGGPARPRRERAPATR